MPSAIAAGLNAVQDLHGRRPAECTSANVGADSPDFIELVLELSCKLAGADHEQIDTLIRRSLQRVVEFFAADRGVIYEIQSCDGRIMVNEQVESGVEKTFPPFCDIRELFPWLFDQVVLRRKPVYVSSLDALPAEAACDRGNLLARGTRSALFVPLLTSGAVNFVLSLGCSRDHPDWAEEHIPRLRLLGDALVGVIRRKALEDEREESLRFERLIAGASASLASAWSDKIAERIEQVLKDVLDYTHNDQAGFFTVFEETGEVYLTYLNHVDEVAPGRKRIEYAQFNPWLYQTIVGDRQTYVLNALDDLPPEASIDRAHLADFGTRSGVYIPYEIDGTVQYIFAVVSNSREQCWSPSLVEHLKILGGVFVNALARQSVADAMRQSERGLLEAQRVANLGSWEWDVLTDRILTSTQTEQILDTRVTSFGEFMGSIHPDDRENVRHTIEAGLSVPQTKCRIEHRICRPDGEERVTESHFEVIRAASEASPHVLGTIQDITVRRKSEQELESLRAQQWHTDRVAQTAVLISSLAHELCQPLTAILSNAQAGLRLLGRGMLPAEETARILEDIVADDKRAGKVIESLRVMLRRRVTEHQVIDCAQMGEDVMALLRSEYIKQDVLMQSELGVGCRVMGDQAQLQQVLINLLMNGMEAMRDKTASERHLVLRVFRDEPGKVVFSVADTGSGLNAKDSLKVFDAFWTTKPKGIGMGLAICRSIIEAHGGRIWVESTTGPGATFSFSLPAVEQ